MRTITINDIRFDPATAEYVTGHPGGDYHFDPGEMRRFDEHLYRTPEGYWFILRPLAPDEVRAWMTAHDDDVLLRRTFPGDGGAEYSTESLDATRGRYDGSVPPSR